MTQSKIKPARSGRARGRPFGNGTFSRVACANLSMAQTPWYEDEDAIRRGLEWGLKKARMLEWVESQMPLRLTPMECRCIELYYFGALNYREAAQLLDVNASTVYRAVRSGVVKLRKQGGSYVSERA